MKFIATLTPERRALLAQLLRYGLTGGFVTLCQAAVYWTLAGPTGAHPQIANVAGYLVAVGLGYFLHGAYSFRGHGGRDRPIMRGIRFFLGSLVSLAINALWVWLTTGLMRWPDWSPIPAMLFITPLLVFTINRHWVFR